MIPYKLLQELNKLACTSKNKKIEDLFVKLAEESQNKFFEWISKSKGNKQILSKLEDPNLLASLDYLYKNPNVFSQDLLSLLHMFLPGAKGTPAKVGKSELGYVSILSKLLPLSQDPEFETVLKPFEASLTKLDRLDFKEGDIAKKESVDKIKRDFKTLIKEYRIFLNPPEHKSETYDRRDARRFKKQYHITDSSRRNLYLRDGEWWEVGNDGGRADLSKLPESERTRLVNDARWAVDEEVSRSAEYERITKTYGFFLYNFTEEILSALRDSPDPIMSNIETVIVNKRLAHTGEVAKALPYIPNVEGVSKAILTSYNGIRTGTWLKSGGPTNAFNKARSELLRSINVPFRTIDTPEEEPLEEDTLDDSAFYESQGAPRDLAMPTETDRSRRPAAMTKLDYGIVGRSNYIFAVSLLLSKLRTSILQFGE